MPENTLSSFIEHILNGYNEESINSFDNPDFGWEYGINDFELEINETTITLEPVAYVVTEKKTILLEIYTELFEWFFDRDTSNKINILQKIDDKTFLTEFIEETKDYHFYSNDTKKEIMEIYISYLLRKHDLPISRILKPYPMYLVDLNEDFASEIKETKQIEKKFVQQQPKVASKLEPTSEIKVESKVEEGKMVCHFCRQTTEVGRYCGMCGADLEPAK